MENNVIDIARSERGGYKIRIDGRDHTSPTPEPTGGELLALIGRDPDRFVLALQLPKEPDRLVAFDETIDLTASGVEEFTLISKERYYSFRIDEQPLSITEPMPTGRTLLKLVGKAPETHLLNLNLPYQDDELIGADELVDLRKPGREQFSVTAKDPLAIVIDEVRYEPVKKKLTGVELRNLPKPPVPDDRDLWRDVPGKDDSRIKPADTIELVDGMVFYTAPSTINPGGLN